MAVVDSYDDEALTNRNIVRLDSTQIYGTVNGFSDTTITLDGSTFNFNQDSYIIGSLAVGQKAFVGLSEDGSSALVVNSSLVPTAISLNGQTASSSTTFLALISLSVLVIATWGVAWLRSNEVAK